MAHILLCKLDAQMAVKACQQSLLSTTWSTSPPESTPWEVLQWQQILLAGSRTFAWKHTLLLPGGSPCTTT